MSFQNEHFFLVIKEMSFLWLGVEYYKFCINAPLEAALGRSWPYWRPGRWSVHPGKAPADQ